MTGRPQRELSAAQLERALADLFGGFDGGWALWRAALSAIEVAVERSSEGEGRFCAYPAGELRRLAGDLEAALQLALAAAGVQDLLNGDDPADRSNDVAGVLLARVRSIAARSAA